MLVAAYGGLRVGEVGALKRDDFDTDTCELNVRGTVIRTFDGATIAPPKSRAREDFGVLALGKVPCAALKKHLEEFGTASDGAHLPVG